MRPPIIQTKAMFSAIIILLANIWSTSRESPNTLVKVIVLLMVTLMVMLKVTVMVAITG